MKVLLDPGAYMPIRAHSDDAGLDLLSMEDAIIEPGEHVALETGVHVEIPTGYVGLVTSKSGLMLKGITVRGTIDAGYRGSIKAVVFNHGPDVYRVWRGSKVCQLVIMPIITPELEIVDRLGDSDRGDGGFGSTGV